MLNERQRRFVDAYAQRANGAQAARQAGYSYIGAARQANRLLANVAIRRALNERLAALADERTADLVETLTFATAVMRGQVSDTTVIGGEVVTLPASVKARCKACEMLMKVCGACPNVQANSGFESRAIVISGADKLED